MPWENFAEMTDADVRSLYRYLRSLTPVRGRRPAVPPAGRLEAGQLVSRCAVDSPRLEHESATFVGGAPTCSPGPFPTVCIGQGDAWHDPSCRIQETTPSVARTSPLYCRYNGFLLGQFLSLAFAECGAPRYGDRRARLLEFLREVDIDVAIPQSPLDRGGVTYAGVLLGDPAAPRPALA